MENYRFGSKCKPILLVFILLLLNKSRPTESCLTGEENSYRQGWIIFNGKPRCCDTCPKGMYMTGVCDIGQPDTTRCDHCKYGTYTDIPNLSDNCMVHNQCITSQHKKIKVPGTATNDFICECEFEYYELQSGDCKSWRECPTGHGVLIQGSPTHDVVCQECPSGTFSDVVDKTSECTPHRSCKDEGLLTLKYGTTEADAVCAAPPTTAQQTSPSSGVSLLTSGNHTKEIIIGIVCAFVFIVIVIVVVIFKYRRHSNYRRTMTRNVQGQQRNFNEEYLSNPPEDSITDTRTDTLPAGATASKSPSLRNGSIAGTSGTGNSNTKLQVPIGMSESNYRGNRHPSSQDSSTNRPTPTNTTEKQPKAAIPNYSNQQPLGESSVYGLSEAGSHPSRTTETDLGRIVRTRDDGMPTSGSDCPSKERQVHREAQQDQRSNQSDNRNVDARDVVSEGAPLL